MTNETAPAIEGADDALTDRDDAACNEIARLTDCLDDAHFDHQLRQELIEHTSRMWNGLADFITELRNPPNEPPKPGSVEAWHAEDIIDRLIQIAGADPTWEPDE